MAIIHRTRVVGTRRVIFSAWEPSRYAGPHHTVMTIEGRVCGRLGTQTLPEELARMPRSDERVVAVREWQTLRHEEAYAAIVAAHPEVAGGERRCGEIEVSLETLVLAALDRGLSLEREIAAALRESDAEICLCLGALINQRRARCEGGRWFRAS